jgi:hypothetical protein
VSWNEADLDAALSNYEALCRQNRMTAKAVHSYWDYARRFLAWRTGDYVPRGIAPGGRPTARAAVTTADLRVQVREYAKLLDRARLSQPAIDTYLRHAMFFLRWLDGEFIPGARTRA